MKYPVLTFLLFFNTISAFGQREVEKIDSVMNLFFDYIHFSGTVLVSDNGKVIYKKAFGFANREWNVANTTNTVFKSASLGKQFTALLILQLVEQGKIKLDDHISDYIEDYPAESGKLISIHQLLTHSSGIPNYHAIEDYELNAGRTYSPEEYISLFKNKPLLFSPGTQFQYSNPGYFLLGHIAEKVTKLNYDELIRKKIFEPAGMQDSYTEFEKSVIPCMANGYNNMYTYFETETYRNPSQKGGAGVVMTSVEDFFKYDQALESEILLSKKYQQLMYTAYVNGYGYGWNVSYYPQNNGDSTLLIYHDGYSGGFNSIAYRFVEDKRLIVAFSNSAPLDMMNIARAIGRILYQREEVHPKKWLVEQFAVTLKEHGIDSAVSEFRYLMKHRSDLYELDGTQFNILGYSYMKSGMLAEALEVFKLNVESFPEIGDPYDSLAEAYMKSGKNDLAIRNYKKALELDPNNANAMLMLERLQGNK
jgi:CubicO group peptidase (beta-lactamase class C family)